MSNVHGFANMGAANNAAGRQPAQSGNPPRDNVHGFRQEGHDNSAYRNHPHRQGGNDNPHDNDGRGDGPNMMMFSQFIQSEQHNDLWFVKYLYSHFKFLSVANVIFAAWVATYLIGLIGWDQHLLIPLRFIGEYGVHSADMKSRWYWHIFVALLAHGPLYHIVLNIVYLCSKIYTAESLMGPWKTLLLLFVCGFSGIYFGVACHKIAFRMVAATTMSAGLIGFSIAHLILSWEQHPLVALNIIEIIFKILFLFLIVMNVRNNALLVDYLAHLGGLLQGVFLSLVFLPTLEIYSSWQNKARIVGAVLATCLLAGSALGFHLSDTR